MAFLPSLQPLKGVKPCIVSSWVSPWSCWMPRHPHQSDGESAKDYIIAVMLADKGEQTRPLPLQRGHTD